MYTGAMIIHPHNAEYFLAQRPFVMGKNSNIASIHTKRTRYVDPMLM